MKLPFRRPAKKFEDLDPELKLAEHHIKIERARGFLEAAAEAYDEAGLIAQLAGAEADTEMLRLQQVSSAARHGRATTTSARDRILESLQ